MSGLTEGALSVTMQQESFDPVMLINTPVFDGESEEGLALRFGRKHTKPQELVFEYTRDPALLHQYFHIYHSQCRIIPEFLEAEEEYNRKSHMLIARQGNLVVGGARIFIVTPRARKKMLLELAGFSLQDHFPELELQEKTYAEVSRLVLLPEFRSPAILHEMFYNVYRKCDAMKVDVMYAAAPLVNVRSYRKICKSIGLKNPTVHMNIDIPRDPGFEEVKDYLFSAINDRNSAEPMDAELLPESFNEPELM